MCKIWVSYCRADNILSLLGCDNVSFGKWFLTFLKIFSPASSTVNQSHPGRLKSYVYMLVISMTTNLGRQIQNKVEVAGMSQGETDAGKDSPVQWMLPAKHLLHQQEVIRNRQALLLHNGRVQQLHHHAEHLNTRQPTNEYKITVLWGIMLCSLVQQYLFKMVPNILKGCKSIKNILFLDWLLLRMKVHVNGPFKMSETTRQTTQYHIPQNLNTQPDFSFRFILPLLAAWGWSCHCLQ